MKVGCQYEMYQIVKVLTIHFLHMDEFITKLPPGDERLLIELLIYGDDLEMTHISYLMMIADM